MEIQIPWWHFWNPFSGVIGGLIFSAVFVLLTPQNIAAGILLLVLVVLLAIRTSKKLGLF